MSRLESDVKKLHKNINLLGRMLSKIPTLSRDQSKLIASLLHDFEACLNTVMVEIRIIKGGKL